MLPVDRTRRASGTVIDALPSAWPKLRLRTSSWCSCSLSMETERDNPIRSSIFDSSRWMRNRLASILLTTTASKSSSCSSTSGMTFVPRDMDSDRDSLSLCSDGAFTEDCFSMSSSFFGSVPRTNSRKVMLHDASAPKMNTGAALSKAPILAWASYLSLSGNASPAINRETVSPTLEMTPANIKWRRAMPSGRSKPRYEAIRLPAVIPNVFPMSKPSKTTNEKPPVSRTSTPAFTAPNANNTKKSTKPLTDSSKSCNGLTCACSSSLVSW
mmetsp:Transcript_26216/g.68096  ORF Transcript_26216/g.68096 Transcript_26216/m.68096 type:complete len:270 (+) Transcript_26216:95-904(+)